MRQNCDIILASASPRRRELLTDMGLRFDVCPADIDEEGVRQRSPRSLVKTLSRLKAEKAAKDGAAVIAADTVVVFRGRIFGKPHNETNAVRMLSAMSGKWHTVYTGVTVLYDGKRHTFSARSRVKFKALSAEDIASYVDRVKPFDKAGAYGIQDNEVVEKYRGSYNNIVGLPTERLAVVLNRAGALSRSKEC